MSLMPHFPDGYYDDNGEWQRTKYCFMSCGAACTCMPPFGQHYSAAHDKRTGADCSSPSGIAGSRQEVGVETSDALHVPLETTDAPETGARKVR